MTMKDGKTPPARMRFVSADQVARLAGVSRSACRAPSRRAPAFRPRPVPRCWRPRKNSVTTSTISRVAFSPTRAVWSHRCHEARSGLPLASDGRAHQGAHQARQRAGSYQYRTDGRRTAGGAEDADRPSRPGHHHSLRLATRQLLRTRSSQWPAHGGHWSS